MQARHTERSGGWTWLLALLLFTSGSGAEPDVSPRELVMKATGDMLTALEVSGDQIRRNPALAHQLAEDLVVPLLDFRGISRQALGKHWREATTDQRKRFTEAFRTFLLNLYVTAMVTYTEEIVSVAKDIEFPPIHWSPRQQRVSVPMVIRLRNGARAELKYRMNSYSGSWRIHDVTVFGISFASTYRNSFSTEIREHGLDELISRLEAKNRETRAAEIVRAEAR
jgi:phospholipid transport system substrate-binding protein